MTREEIPSLETRVFPGFAPPGQRLSHGIPALDLPNDAASRIAGGEISLYRGKVRDSFTTSRGILMVTTDRISAFDRILDVIPAKGEILNRISLYWFGQTEDIIESHILEAPGGRSVFVKPAAVLPVEVVVRGYLTGSAWRDYQSGRRISGIGLPSGMRENQRFDEPLITPSTKAAVGTHDEPISSEEILARGLVSPDIWGQVVTTATALFARGRELAEKRGLLLVDTKYEFGIFEDRLILVDEIHTPDSSRYWLADSYDEAFSTGQPPAKLDKEYLRRWLMEQGFMGDGQAPEIPPEVRRELAWKYIQAFEMITGEKFSPVFSDIESELEVIGSYL